MDDMIPEDEDSVPHSLDPPIYTWLKISYVLLPIWGIITFFIFWNGSFGWLDRGYWQELQEAANTTYPFVNHNEKSAN